MCQFKSKNSFMFCMVFNIIGLLASVGFFFFLTPIFNSLIKKSLKSQLVLTKDSVDTWGNIPGQYNLTVTREIVLFDFTNPDSLMSGEKPVLKMVDPVKIQELNIISNITESTSKDEISFTNTYQLVNLTSSQEEELKLKTLMDTQVTIPNLYAMGLWATAKSLPDYQKAVGALGSLVLGLEFDDGVWMGALGSGVWGAFIQNKKEEDLTRQYFQPNDITDPNIVSSMLKDPIFGLMDNSTSKYLIQAAYRGIESDQSLMLMQHFGVERSAFQGLLSQLRGNINTIKGLLTDYYKCPSGSCTSRYLGYMQLANQGLTLNAPLPPVMPSIVSNNFTAFGYPEYSYYVTEIFWKTISDKPEYHDNTAFTEQQFEKLLEHTDTGCSPADYTLLSNRNMQALFDAGNLFDQT